MEGIFSMDWLESLTEREMEVLTILSCGKRNKEIAKSLNISINTVEKHLRNIFRKMNVRTRTEAAMMYLRNNEIENHGNP